MTYPNLHRALYFLSFSVRLALGKQWPVIAGISITDVCNLSCAHCWRSNQGAGHVPFEEVVATLEDLHGRGARYLYIQGGEPFSWSDRAHSVREVVTAARRIGFFHVAVCTNGTYPLDAEPDSFSVSLDGLREAHDRIRCGTYDRVLANIEASSHSKIFLNTTFNRRNAADLSGLLRLAARSSRIRGVVVNFHIPYPGVEGLALGLSERARICYQAIRLKRRGWPVLNSVSGLRAMARNDWRRPLDLSVVSDCRSFYSCCRARGNKAICRQCGYAGWAEVSQVFSLNLPGLVEMFFRMHSR